MAGADDYSPPIVKRKEAGYFFRKMLKVSVDSEHRSVAFSDGILKAGLESRPFAAVLCERDMLDVVLFEYGRRFIGGTVVDNQEVLIANVLFYPDDQLRKIVCGIIGGHQHKGSVLVQLRHVIRFIRVLESHCIMLRLRSA